MTAGNAGRAAQRKCKVGENVLNIFFANFFFFFFSFMLFLLLLFLYRGCCRFAVVLFVCSLPQVKTGTQRDIPVWVCVYVYVCVSVRYYRNDFKHSVQRTHNTADRWSCASETTYASRFHFHFPISLQAYLSACLYACVCVWVSERACVRACEWNNGAMFDLHCKSWQFCKMSSYIRNNMFYLLTFDFDFADSLPTVCTKAWAECVLFLSLALFYLRVRI